MSVSPKILAITTALALTGLSGTASAVSFVSDPAPFFQGKIQRVDDPAPRFAPALAPTILTFKDGSWVEESSFSSKTGTPPRLPGGKFGGGITVSDLASGSQGSKPSRPAGHGGGGRPDVAPVPLPATAWLLLGGLGLIGGAAARQRRAAARA